MLKHKYIVVEGNIGSGKSSLAKMLAHRFNADLVLESFDGNSFLHRFYEEPARYAFPLELSFMADRYNQLRGHVPGKAGATVVSDYLFDKCLLFARANLNSEELKLFEEFFRMLAPRLPRPDLVIFLEKEVDQLLHNIGKRGRWFESGISEDYLRRIDREYSAHLPSLEGTPLMKVSNRLDFVNNPVDYLKIIDDITNT